MPPSRTSPCTLTLHLKNIFEDKELAPAATVKESLTTAADGKRYPTRLYKLDAILAVGYPIFSRAYHR